MPNTQVAAAATQSVRIPGSGPMLLGVAGKPDDMHALIRLPGGKVTHLQVGARLNGSEVVGIDHTGVVLHKRGKTTRLDLIE